MNVRRCTLLALAAALSGVILRATVPVLPPDDALRAVIAFYASVGPR